MDIKDKIQKLLALSKSDNQHEAELAASMAQDLMVKYAIEESELNPDDRVNSKINDPMSTDKVGLNTARVPRWIASLSLAIAKSMFCQCYYVPGIDVYIVGRKSHREAFFVIFNRIRTDLERMADRSFVNYQIHNRESSVHGKTWKKSFFLGAVSAIRARLQTDLKKLVNDNSGVALVVADKEKEVSDYIAQIGMNLRNTKTAATRLNADAYQNGYNVGNSMDISGQSNNRLALNGRAA